MKNDEIAEQLSVFIQEEIVDENIQVTSHTDLAALGVDSFSLMSIILFIERMWNLTLPMEQLTPENTQSPLALAKCVQQNLNDSAN